MKLVPKKLACLVLYWSLSILSFRLCFPVTYNNSGRCLSCSLPSGCTLYVIIPSGIPVQKSRLLKIGYSLHWNASSITVNPNAILVNLNILNGLLNVAINKQASFCQYGSMPC